MAKKTASKKKQDEPKKKSPKQSHPLEQFGTVRREFILDNIRIIDYRDLAKLAGVKEKDLKEAVEAMGIKLPIERARRWKDLDVGIFRSLANCARCQVQLRHNTFLVGDRNCHTCCERNIKRWLDEEVKIMARFDK